MKLYYHKTSGGAEYLFDTFIECDNGHKEGIINDKTKYIVRIERPDSTPLNGYVFHYLQVEVPCV